MLRLNQTKVCPKLKQIKLKNQHKQQEVNDVIFSDTECYMKGADEKIGSNTYKISEHASIAISYNYNCNHGSYFGPDCIKDYVRNSLEIETKHSIKINKAMLFTEEDKLYHDANDICLNGNKNCVNKVKRLLSPNK